MPGLSANHERADIAGRGAGLSAAARRKVEDDTARLLRDLQAALGASAATAQQQEQNTEQQNLAAQLDSLTRFSDFGARTTHPPDNASSSATSHAEFFPTAEGTTAAKTATTDEGVKATEEQLRQLLVSLDTTAKSV